MVAAELWAWVPFPWLFAVIWWGGKSSGCMHPALVLLGIERKTCYHSRSGMEDHSWLLPVSFPDGTNWNCVKAEQPQRFQSWEWLWCEEGQDAAVSWPRAGQQGGGNVSIVWISMEPHRTMCAQTHWARRRWRGCCTRAFQKALNVFLFEKQRVLVKNIWLKHTSHSFSQFPIQYLPPKPKMEAHSVARGTGLKGKGTTSPWPHWE